MTNFSTKLSPGEALRIALSRFTLTTRTILPAIVDSEPKKNGRFWVVDVVPAINRVVKNGAGETTTKADEKISNVPIYVAGTINLGLSITVPINIGDNCLLVVSDRGLDNWQIADGFQDPPELEEIRHHDITDVICMPMGSTLEAIDVYDTESIQIRNADSTTVFSVKTGEIKALVEPNTYVLTDSFFDINITGDINMVASGNITTTAGGDITSSAEGNVDIDAGGNTSSSAGGSADITAGGSIGIGAGGSVDISGSAVNLN